MKDFNSLRKKYTEFIYHDYSIVEDEKYFLIEYDFEIPELSTFKPIIKILKKDIKFNKIDSNLVRNIVFNIGMVEIISYWKCACPKTIIVECGNLSLEQIEWFKKLYYYGLGEYRYINNIQIGKEEFVDIISKGNNIENIEETYINNLSGTLIPIGGGKDSAVTLELLEKDKEDNFCLMIGGKKPSRNTVQIAQYEDNRIIDIERIIDKNLLELNKQGYLNGHTPFSALLAFISYLIAYLTNKKYIVLSNESSANESNVNGDKINHQYSKSFEFEQDFREYAIKCLRREYRIF